MHTQMAGRIISGMHKKKIQPIRCCTNSPSSVIPFFLSTCSVLSDPASAYAVLLQEKSLSCHWKYTVAYIRYRNPSSAKSRNLLTHSYDQKSASSHHICWKISDQEPILWHFVNNGQFDHCDWEKPESESLQYIRWMWTMSVFTVRWSY